MRKAWAAAVLIGLVLGVVGVLLVGRIPVRKPLRKLVVLGVDGGDWSIIRPLVDRGRLPNFARLMESGAWGELASMEPTLSPLLWTTIATGKDPEYHGILSFTVTDPETGTKVPMTSDQRKVGAFWNFLSRYGFSVDVVGWLATYPAEHINGVMVSDRLGYLAFASVETTSSLQGKIYPPDRAEEIGQLVVRASDLAYAEIRPFLRIDRETFLSNRDIPFEPGNPVNNLILLYATAKTMAEIGLHLLERDHPDLLAVYFEWIDAVGHLFMPYAPPRRSVIPAKEYQAFSGTVEAAYVYQDRLLGRFMSACDDNTVLLVLSDHGFRSGDNRLKGVAEIRAGKAAMWHTLRGIVAFYGSGVRKGPIEGASIMDITPTILALMGLPKAKDMPGRILKEAFEPGLARRLGSAEVATLEGGTVDRERAAAGKASGREEMKKLEALGYVAGDNPAAFNNLGQRYQEKGQFRKAIGEYKKALELKPNYPEALNNLGICYSRLRRYREAEEAFLRAISLKRDDVYAMSNLAAAYLEQGKLEEARRYGEMAVKMQPKYANAHLTLGAVYATMGKADLAEKEFKAVLAIEPGNRMAEANLKKLKEAAGRPR